MHTYHEEIRFPAGTTATTRVHLSPRTSNGHWKVRVVTSNIPAANSLRFDEGTRLMHSNSDLIAVGQDATAAVAINYRAGPMSLRLCDLFGTTTVAPAADVIALLEFIEA